MANKRKYIGILAAAVTLVMLFTGCDINIGDYHPEDELVLSSGYAWVTEDVDVDFDWFEINIDIGNRYGYIFHSDDTVDLIEEYGDDWEIVSTKDWSVRSHGDELKIGSKTFYFEVDDDDELWLDGQFFEKKRVGNVN